MYKKGRAAALRAVIRSFFFFIDIVLASLRKRRGVFPASSGKNTLTPLKSRFLQVLRPSDLIVTHILG